MEIVRKCAACKKINTNEFYRDSKALRAQGAWYIHRVEITIIVLLPIAQHYVEVLAVV